MASHLMSLERIESHALSPLISIPGIVILGLVWMISRVVYNVYFHPLHSYPGPFLAAAFQFYRPFLEVIGSQHIKIKQWHDTYGEVVRIGPNSLSYNAGQAWEDICGHRTGSRKALFDKDQGFYVSAPNGEPSIVASTGDHHRRLRRLLAHAFSEKALRAQEACITGYVDQLITQLKVRENTDNGIVNMVHWFNFTTFDIIGDLSFGESLEMLKDGVWSKYLVAILGAVQFGSFHRAVRSFFPLTWKAWLNLLTPKRVLDDRIFIFNLAKERLARRIAHDTDRYDFVHYMLHGSESLSFEKMVSQSQVLLIAGSETTATALSGMLYYLLNNPNALSRLTEEIRTFFAKETDINMQSTTQLPYLQAVIEEGLRIYPPVPNILPRSTPEPGEIICGKFVPGGTSVGIHQLSTFRSSRNFIDPDSFHPERWLGDPRFSNDDKSVFHPFSYGPRNCIGKNLAYAELRLIMARFFWNFDVELQPESKHWDQQKTNALWEKIPLYVKVTSRK